MEPRCRIMACHAEAAEPTGLHFEPQRRGRPRHMKEERPMQTEMV